MKLKLQVAVLEAARQIDQRIAKGRQLCMALVHPDFPLADYERKRILWYEQTVMTLAAIFEDVTAVNEIIEEAESKAGDELAKRPPILVGRRVDDAEAILLRRKDAARTLEKEISRLEDIRDLVEYSDEPVFSPARMSIKKMSIIKEFQRLRQDFEAKAEEYYDLNLTVHYAFKGVALEEVKFRQPNHAINLWQYMGNIINGEMPAGIDTIISTRFGLLNAEVSCLGVVEGEKTDLFVKMANRAGSLIPSKTVNTITTNVMDKVIDKTTEGKPVFVCNPNPVAVWLNLMLTIIQTYQPNRYRDQRLTVDLFAASLSAVDYIIESIYQDDLNRESLTVQKATQRQKDLAAQFALSPEVNMDNPNQLRRLPVFISYAHADNEGPDQSKRYLDRLLEMLHPLKLQDQVCAWSDQDISMGDDWQASIQFALANAKAAVLLVSPAFMKSEYIRNSELPILLKNANESGVVILPIILRHCLFKETSFKYPDPTYGPHEFTLASLQAANSPSKPLNAMAEHEQDEVLLSVAQRLLKIVKA